MHILYSRFLFVPSRRCPVLESINPKPSSVQTSISALCMRNVFVAPPPSSSSPVDRHPPATRSPIRTHSTLLRSYIYIHLTIFLVPLYRIHLIQVISFRIAISANVINFFNRSSSSSVSLVYVCPYDFRIAFLLSQ